MVLDDPAEGLVEEVSSEKREVYLGPRSVDGLFGSRDGRPVSVAMCDLSGVARDDVEGREGGDGGAAPWYANGGCSKAWVKFSWNIKLLR